MSLIIHLIKPNLSQLTKWINKNKLISSFGQTNSKYKNFFVTENYMSIVVIIIDRQSPESPARQFLQYFNTRAGDTFTLASITT